MGNLERKTLEVGYGGTIASASFALLRAIVWLKLLTSMWLVDFIIPLLARGADGLRMRGKKWECLG